jgi:Zn-dependent protease/CBS domain-containing protein
VSASIRIGRILGIPIYLHLTFLLILPLFIYAFSDPNRVEFFGIPLSFTDLNADTWVKYSFGTVTTIVFFASIVAHELAHSYLALRYGVHIRSITLMIFGGVASMEEMPRQPGQELKMAFAGPLSSLLIAGAASVGAILFGSVGGGSMVMDGVSIMFGIVAFYSALLAGFNLVPAFPMDGGRVLRAHLATKMPYIEATRKAARIGKYIAIGMGVLGIFNIWLILIALFVYIGASEEEQATTISESLHGVTVRQLMSDAVQVVHPDTTVQQLHDIILSTRHKGFPVVEGGLVGIVTLSDTHRVPREHLPFARVRDIMTREVVTVPPEMEAVKALNLLSERKIDRLVVLDGGRLAGIVTKNDFMRAVDVMMARSRMVWGQGGPPQPPYAPPPSPPTASS